MLTKTVGIRSRNIDKQEMTNRRSSICQIPSEIQLHGRKPRRKHVKLQLPVGAPEFIHITQNELPGRKYKKLKEEDIVVCDCKYDPSDPDSACGEGCLNVMTNTECTPCYCRCGDWCKNQKFQKCEYARTQLFNTGGRGWGLLADENIEAGRFIIEYCGEVISSEEAKQRAHTYESEGLKDAYIISLHTNYFIDATRKGSLARFINHSCQPNCETRKWTVLGEVRVGIFAKQDIRAGTELAYDYNFEWYGGDNVRCLCGASNCSKFLGAKSHAFLEHNHVWEEGDDRYTVEEVPLYDSAEDELSLEVPNNGSFFEPELEPSQNNNVFAVMDVSTEQQLQSSSVVSEPAFLFQAGKAEMGPEKTFAAQVDPIVPQNGVQNGSPNIKTGSGSFPKKRLPPMGNRKSKYNGGKQVDGKHIARLFSSKEAQEEIIQCEETKSRALSNLNSLYDEIRPAIEEHERENQDNVSIGLADKWIGASCASMRAEFDFHFSIIKNVLCPRPQSAEAEAKPTEGTSHENGTASV